MCLYSGKILYMDAFQLTSNTIVGVYQPQPCPLIPIPLDVASAKNGPDKFSRPLAFVVAAAGGENLVAFRRGDDEGFVVAGLDAIVDLDIPILEGCADGFDFPLDALLDG